MKTIYIHIGTHKTGTTTLQSILRDNHNLLLQRGYYYPKHIGISETPGNHTLAWAISYGDQMFHKQTDRILDLSQVWHEFLKGIPESIDKVVISCEYFSLFKEQDLAVLKAYLSDFHVKPILYLRDPSDFFTSLYSENVKSSAYFEPLQTFVDNNAHRGNYSQIIDQWSHAFGSENMIVGIYAPKTSGYGLFADFCRKIDLDNEALPLKLRKSRLNVTPPVKLLKILRYFNWLFRGKLSLPLSKCRQLYLYRIVNHRMVKLVSLIPNWLISNRWLSAEEEQKLFSQFEDGNREVMARYLDQESRILR